MSTLALQDDEEVSRQDVMQRLLQSNDKYADVNLVGSDGGVVPAVRCLLAARSPTLDRLLYGNNHATTKSVTLPYPTHVLQRLVRYIYTDSLAMTAAVPSTCAALADAGLSYALPCLAHEALQVLMALATESTTMAIQALNATAVLPALHATDTTAALVKLVLRDMDALLENDGRLARRLDAQALHLVLQCQTVHVSELDLFHMVLAWSKAEQDDDDCHHFNKDHCHPHDTCSLHSNSSHTVDESCSEEDDDHDDDDDDPDDSSTTTILGIFRQAQARNLVAQYIDLTLLSPRVLDTVVAPSGLVTMEQLLQTYQAQALRAELQHNVSFTRLRGPVWQSTGTVLYSGRGNASSSSSLYETELLSCPGLKLTWGSIYKWSYDIKGMRGNAYSMGVMADTTLDTTVPLHQQPDHYAWSMNQDGVLQGPPPRSGNRRVHRLWNIKKATNVTFILDLQTTETGTLAIALDGGNPIVLFDNMTSTTPGDGVSGSDTASMSSVSKGDDDDDESNDKQEQEHHDQHEESKVGFLPAVSIGSNSVIRFLGFDE